MNQYSREISLSYRVVDNTLKPLSEDEEIGLVIYIAEKERRKPSFLRRIKSVESIKSILKINYPVLVRRLNQDYVILHDLFRDSSIKISYYELMHDDIEKVVKELEYLKNRDFLDKLTLLEKIAKNISEFKTHVVEKTTQLKNTLIDSGLVREISSIINKTLEYSITSVKLPVRELDVESNLKEINNVLETCSKTHGYIMSLLGRIEKYYERWREDVLIKYTEKIRELENELNTVREEVKAKIEEYSSKLHEEVDKTTSEYSKLISDLDKKIIELENKLKTTEEEERRVREYGGDLGSVKKKKKEVEKELKQLRKKKEEYIERKESSVREIEEKYRKLIESERSRVADLENQIKRINEELESLIKLCSSRIESIKTHLLKFIDVVKSVEKNIFDSLIPMPTGGEGVYWIPTYVVNYRSARGERIYLITPLKTYSASIFKSLKIDFFENIRNFLNIVRETSEKDTYKQVFETHNLLRNIPIERIENCLKILVDNGFIRSKEYEKVVKNIRNQINLLK